MTTAPKKRNRGRIRGQKFAGTMWQNVLLEKMPRQLIQDAKLKAQAYQSTLKRQIELLLMAWTYTEDNVVFEEEDEI